MSDYDNSAALWKRQPRETGVAGKSYPNYTGKGQVNGKIKIAAAWLGINKTKDTQPDINIKLSDPQEQSQSNNEEQPF